MHNLNSVEFKYNSVIYLGFQSAKIGRDVKNSVSFYNFSLSMSAKIKLKSCLSKIANSQSVLQIIDAAL